MLPKAAAAPMPAAIAIARAPADRDSGAFDRVPLPSVLFLIAGRRRAGRRAGGGLGAGICFRASITRCWNSGYIVSAPPRTAISGR